MMKEQQSFSVKKEWIVKLIEEAFGSGRPFWSLVFNFGGFDNPDNLYIISQDTFILLQDLLRKEMGKDGEIDGNSGDA